jgi:hypothetical protein
MKSFKEYQEDAGGAGGAAAVGAAATGTVTAGVSGTGDNPDKTVPVFRKKQKQYTSEQNDPNSVEQTSKYKATPASVRQRVTRHRIANERETEHSLRKRAAIVSNIPNVGTVPSSKSTPRRITGSVNMESFVDFRKKSKIKAGSGVGPQTFMTKESVQSGNLTYGYHGTVDAKDDADRAKKYSKMHKMVKKLAHAAGHMHDVKKPNVMVKHFLDSPHGRHIADNPTNQNIISRFGHFKKSYDPSLHEDTVEHQKITTAQNATTSKNPTGFVKVGDSGHLGFGVKGGAGFTGTVTKIEGDIVHMTSKYNKNKTYRGHVSKFTKG